MSRRQLTGALSLALLLSGCGGTSDFEACVQHSVQEGVERSVAEQGCGDAGFER